MGKFLMKILRRLDTIDMEFEMMVLRFVGHVPSHYVRRFFYRLGGMKIGKGSTIHTGATFYDTRNISLGQDTIIGENAVLDGRDKLKIGSHVDIASEVMMYNAEHDVQSDDFHAVSAEVIIGDYVFIGPRAIILPGVHVGNGAVVGAGAVVTKDIAENKIVGGVPAKEIGERNNKDLHYKLGRAAWFR
ncbi:MAG TPA: acyltransferase [Patescibacteria group bacterium]|nr:acyltransferase [Patescibacteria group bacterium]